MQPRLTGVFLAAAIVAAPGAAFAGGKAVIETSSAAHMPGMPNSGPSRMIVSWRGPKTVRIQTAGEKNYLLLRGDKTYSVTFETGHARVMDMAEMSKFMNGRMAQFASHGRHQKKKPGANSFGSIAKIDRTGASKTVAGIRGDVYRVTSTGLNGKPKTQNWVLTSDPAAVAMTDAYMNAMKAMFPSRSKKNSVTQWQSSLPGNERGLLQAGKGYRIVSLSKTTPPASRFALPAKPTSLQQLMGGH